MSLIRIDTSKKVIFDRLNTSIHDILNSKSSFIQEEDL